MKIQAFCFLFSILIKCQAQIRQYQNLLDTAFAKQGGIFVHSKPIKDLRLDPDDMWQYHDFHGDYTGGDLDTVMLLQIIKNSKTIDTTDWRDKELPKYVLVNSRGETVLKKHALKKLAFTDKERIKFYKKQINQFNLTDTYHRNLYYFSRPVFDNSQTYAIVQWDNGHSGLGDGGGIVLYHFQDDIWKEVGTIMNWKY
ncbi:MAG: hypothetical protein HZB42_13400 [Sphingobacteriales bacterium]|nr:hypothetical protein [Sphingobacteriales bacterium]